MVEKFISIRYRQVRRACSKGTIPLLGHCKSGDAAPLSGLKTARFAVASSLISPPAPYVTLPLWAARILAFALPVWAAWQGNLTIFELVWVYWVEGWLVLPFMLLRIATAQGPARPDGLFSSLTTPEETEYAVATVWQRLRLMAGLIFIRGGLLLFYLVFIVVFLLLQVTQRDALEHGLVTIAFRNPWANSAWAAFVLAQTMEIGAHYFGNGAWRAASPRSWSSVFDRRTILLHIAIVSTTVMHEFLFKDTEYVSKAEVAYVALFGLLRLGVDGVAGFFSPLRQGRDGGLPA